MRLCKVSTARNIMVLLTQSSDHVTGLASASLTITASKDGGAFNSISPSVTDRGSGWYEIALTSSHTDTLGDLALHITATSADPLDTIMQVVTDLPGDAVSSVTGAVGSVTGAVGSVTGNVAGNVTGSVGSLATQAKTDVENAVWNAATSSHTTAGSFGVYVKQQLLTLAQFVGLWPVL